MANAIQVLQRDDAKDWFRTAEIIEPAFKLQVEYIARTVETTTTPGEFLPTLVRLFRIPLGANHFTSFPQTRYHLLKELTKARSASLDQFFSNLPSRFPQLRVLPSGDPGRLAILQDTSVVAWFQAVTPINQWYPLRMEYFIHEDALGRDLDKKQVGSALARSLEVTSRFPS